MDQDTFLALVRDRISEWNEGDAATISARRSDGSGLVYDSDEHWGACVLDEMSQKIPVI